MIEGYIKKADRKKILLLCDDIRMHSGVATMAREFVVGTAQKYNWYNLGAALKHPEIGKVFEKDKLFNRFYKQSRNPNTWGLGLAIALKVAETSGWGLHYYKEEGLHIFEVNFG